MRGSRVAGLAVIGIATTMFASCGSSSTGSTDNTVTMPFVAELSGSFSHVGLSALAGAETAVHEINEAGGINGRKIKLQPYDGQSDPSAESAAIREVLGTKPSVMLIATVSTAFLPSTSIVESAHVPVVAATPPLPGVSDLEQFSTYPDSQGAVDGPLAVTTDLLGGSLAGKTIAYEGLASSAIGDQRIADFKRAVTAAGGTVGAIYKDSAAIASWAPEASALVKSGADAIVTSNSPATVTTLAKALGTAGFTAPIVMDNATSSDAVLKAINLANVTGTRDARPVVPGSSLYQAVEAAGASTKDAQAASFSSYGYAAVHVAAQTLAKCGTTCSPSSFAKSIRALGPISTPDDAFYGRLDFSGGGASGVTFAQGWSWVPQTQEAKEATPVTTFAGKE